MANGYKYNVVSKATRINPVTGCEIPEEKFYGPYKVVGFDMENFYVVHSCNGYYCSGIEGFEEIAPKVTGFSKALYKVTEY